MPVRLKGLERVLLLFWVYRCNIKALVKVTLLINNKTGVGWFLSEVAQTFFTCLPFYDHLSLFVS